jgi:hypothetical protein
MSQKGAEIRILRIAQMKWVSVFAILCVVYAIGAVPLAGAWQDHDVCPVHGIKMEREVQARNTWIASRGNVNEVSRASQASLEEFFAIVNSRNVNEAMKSMASSMLRTPEQRKAWHRQLSAIRSIHVMKVEPVNIESWNSSRHVFKVTLEAYVENVPDAPIPSFGWHDNPNVRWLTMELNNHRRWVVAGIATGP